jgi:hypothetical protein
MSDLKRFSNINYEGFRALAKDDSLSKYEKIGFPDSYREGFEKAIFSDILNKLTNINSKKAIVADIGPGCSDLPKMMIDLCRNNRHFLILIDSNEMLSHIPDETFIKKVDALYPNCPELFENYAGKVSAILCYSVLQYILVDVAFFSFIDKSLSLLAPGGQMLIGDIPNISKRKRFFSSHAGIVFHQSFMKTKKKPEVIFNEIAHDQIDDSVVISILQRARLAGFDAYVLPQHNSLPMSNRREDILITRP